MISSSGCCRNSPVYSSVIITTNLPAKDRRTTLMLSYQADKPEIRPVPDPAKAAKDPQNIASVEQLFLTGLHLSLIHISGKETMDMGKW